MWRHASGLRGGWRVAALWSLAVASSCAAAQTIDDYSRVQRAAIENAMTQAAARSAGLPSVTSASGLSPAASAPSMPPMPSPAIAMPSAVRSPLPSMAPGIQVSGVFASANTALAEVVVQASAFLLAAGQGVPGTAWRVESVAVDRVVLVRDGAAPAAGAAPGARQVFALPALR